MSTPTSDDIRWAKRALNLPFEAVESVRSLAEKWRTGLTGLTGLVAVVAAVGAPVSGAAIDHDTPRYLFAGAMVGATLALSAGSWLAMSASFGVPRAVANSGEALRAWSKEAADSAVRNLSWARRATVTGFALLATAAALATLSGNDEPSTSSVTTSEGTYCGTLASSGDGSTLTLTSADGTVRTLKVKGEITKIALDSTCGG